MTRNPYEECPPDSEINEVHFYAKRDDNGVWSVSCPQWKCTLHNNQLIIPLQQIAAEIDELNLQCGMDPATEKLYKKLMGKFGIDPAKKRVKKWRKIPDSGERTPRVSLFQAPT